MAKMPVDFMMTLLQMMSMNNGVGDVRTQVVMCYKKRLLCWKGELVSTRI